MSRWFRMYDDLIHDSKVLRLSDGYFRAWVTLLCIASKNGGKLPPTADIALMLRLKPARVAEWLVVLTGHGLLDNNDGVFCPHNWDTRQYKSDSSTDRVKRFREKKRNVSPDVSETAPDTEADTETEIGGGVGPRASVALAPCSPIVSADAYALATTIEGVIGSDRFGPIAEGAPSVIQGWIDAGWDTEVIVGAIGGAMQSLRSAPLSTLRYFDKPIERAHAELSAAHQH